MDYTRRLRPKGIPFSGWGFHELKYRKVLAKLSTSYLKYLEQTNLKETQFFYCRYLKGVQFCMEGIRKGYNAFPVERVRVWTSKRSLRV